ncbi:MAG: hemin-degrading factor [Chthoniobacterales bacterium]
MSETNTTTAIGLAEQWQNLLADKPKTRIRDAATQLGVSEAELLATRCGGKGVTRLEGDFQKLFNEFQKLGRIMCLTRNEDAVHERYGEFSTAEFFGHVGQVVGPDIDLRLFPAYINLAFFVLDETPEGPRKSFQIFDAAGDAVHKVYLQAESDHAAADALVKEYTSANQSTEQAVKPYPASPAPLPDSEIDAEGLQKAWLALEDTHGFYGILRRFRVTREQALRLAPEGYAYRVSLGSTRKMLETASADKTPIMVFVGSRGCIQIHTGPVDNIKMFGEEWLNVLDPDFSMHLREPSIAGAWVVKKPTKDGDITALEIYDKDGEEIALFFGKRKPGQPEDEAWRKIIGELA